MLTSLLEVTVKARRKGCNCSLPVQMLNFPRRGYTGNREAIALYREIIRATRLFHWCNDKGEPWGRILRESSRKEFEQARHETDPLIVARLLVVGRQCLNDTIRGVEQADKRIADRIKETRTR